MARTTGDDYDVSALRAEMAAVQAQLIQERAEYALLQAKVERFEETARETEAAKQAFAKFLEWVALTAEQKTQLVADRDYNADPAAGELWEVGFPEHPTVRLRAHSEYDLIGRYMQLCGITATHPERKFSISKQDNPAGVGPLAK